MSFTGITVAESEFRFLLHLIVAVANSFSVIMMMRVYAIWGAKREILAFLIIFNLVRSITVGVCTASNEVR